MLRSVSELDRYTCGMMVNLVLRSCRPMSDTLTPSMTIRPSAASMIRKSASVKDDFPAPVRPTTPTYGRRRIVIIQNNTGTSVAWGVEPFMYICWIAGYMNRPNIENMDFTLKICVEPGGELFWSDTTGMQLLTFIGECERFLAGGKWTTRRTVGFIRALFCKFLMGAVTVGI